MDKNAEQETVEEQEFPLDSRAFRRSPFVSQAEVGGDTVLFHAKRGAYFKLDEMGVAIWGRLGDDPMQFQDLITGLLGDYDVDDETCRSETRVFMRRLWRNRLVQSPKDDQA